MNQRLNVVSTRCEAGADFPRKPHRPVGNRSSIAFIISSAHLTASAIAFIVAETFRPPSNCANFLAARMLSLSTCARRLE
jgi:hypothetical protein